MGSSARSSCQAVSNSFSKGALAAFLAASAESTERMPTRGTSKTSIFRRMRRFSATGARSGKRLTANMPHSGTESKHLHAIHVGITGNQLHIGVGEESREK